MGMLLLWRCIYIYIAEEVGDCFEFIFDKTEIKVGSGGLHGVNTTLHTV